MNAITPPYFLATKLDAFFDRGPDAQSAKDAEDIVTLAVEVADLVQQVDDAGIRSDVGQQWRETLTKYGLATGDLADFVEWHLDRRERDHLERVVRTLEQLIAA